MCGIVGAFNSGGRLPPLEVFDRCVARLRRRGPDDSGVWSDPRVRLGHTRLAIVDLSPAGHQPMTSPDGRFTIVFNGMFAFAIWDVAEQRLFLARDRIGVKPLYYSWQRGTFAFASRPGAVQPLIGDAGTEVSGEALRAYLELGYIPAPLSFYRSIAKLLPGHYALVDSHGPKLTRYWDYRHIAPDTRLKSRSQDDLVDELDALVRDAVKVRLLSDVPLGAFLSGGVDSAYVVAAMKAVGVSAPKAFTIAFNEQAYDEGPAAAEIARCIGVDHVTETLSVADLLALLPLYVEEFDEPFADSSAFPTMAVARLARQHVTVALSGDGGDELFGGYHYYRIADQLSHTHDWPQPARRMLQMAVGMLPFHRAKLLAGALHRQTPVEVFSFLRSFSKDFASVVTPDVLNRSSSSSDRFRSFAAHFAPGLTSAEVGMRLDLGVTLPDGYLQKVDLSTMAFSLEGRCPFVDYRLVEWAMRLPVSLKLRGGTTKYLLKRALCRYLPPQLVHRPKRGFGAPISQWLRGPLNSWAQDLLHEDRIQAHFPATCAHAGALASSLSVAPKSGSGPAHITPWH